MASAFLANLDVTATVHFDESIDLGSGSFNVGAIGVESVLLVAQGSGLERKSKRAVAQGTFWEELLEYNYERVQGSAVTITVSGRFAFEFADAADLENYVIDDEPIESLVIGWAQDGDSPKTFVKAASFSGSLSDVEDEEAFSGL